MSNLKPIGTRIKEARVRAHLTQSELAELVHVHRDTVSNWETGKHPPDGAVPRIEDALHITLSDEVAAEVPETFTLEALVGRLDAVDRELARARAILAQIVSERSD